MTFQKACAVSELPEAGKVIGVEVAGEPVAIVRAEDGQLYTINDICSHQYVKLSEADVIEGHEIECYLHCARFDIRTGAALCLPATEPIDTYGWKIDGDELLIDVDNPLPHPTQS